MAGLPAPGVPAALSTGAACEPGHPVPPRLEPPSATAPKQVPEAIVRASVVGAAAAISLPAPPAPGIDGCPGTGVPPGPSAPAALPVKVENATEAGAPAPRPPPAPPSPPSPPCPLSAVPPSPPAPAALPATSDEVSVSIPAVPRPPPLPPLPPAPPIHGIDEGVHVDHRRARGRREQER